MTPKHQEQGYTLFLTIFIILLFGVLSLSLMSITISGAKKSSLREDYTQATELAQKGVKKITQEINHDIQEKISSYPGGVTKSHYTELVEQTLSQYTCETKTDYTDGETGKYRSCIEDVGAKETPRKVKINSYGQVDGRERLVKTTVLFGGELEKDYQQYAASTFISEQCAENQANCLPGEGNMFLHGGVALQGDLTVEGNLITSNRSYEKYAGGHWIHSYYPSSLPKSNGETPEVVIGGDVYTFYWDGVSGTKIRNFDYNNHINQVAISTSDPYVKKEEIDQTVFVGSYQAKKSDRSDHPTAVNIDINGEKDKYYYTPNSSGVRVIETNLFGTEGVDRVIYNGDFRNDRIFPKWYSNYGGKFRIRGKSTFKQYSSWGDLQLGGVRLNNDIEFINGAYVAGNLQIDDNTKVKGPIYVEGNLEINGRNIEIDSVIYVNGSVHIRHATLEGDDQLGGSFIIYANENIVVERMNRFNDNPAIINAFLYSKKSIEMDGNESNLEIRGGISAPRIVLNSIRGRSYAGTTIGQSNPQIIEGRAYEGYQEQAVRPSRLKIIYEDDIFNKYSNLLLEERISKVAPPQIIDIEEGTN